MSEWIDRGFFVSFAGTVTYPKSDALRSAALKVPMDRILIETDAPVLAPQAHRGQRNEPAFIAATYACIADARTTSTADLVKSVSRNAASLFGPRW